MCEIHEVDKFFSNSYRRYIHIYVKCIYISFYFPFLLDNYIIGSCNFNIHTLLYIYRKLFILSKEMSGWFCRYCNFYEIKTKCVDKN